MEICVTATDRHAGPGQVMDCSRHRRWPVEIVVFRRKIYQYMEYTIDLPP
jgi:hypothetical protein